jgi:hypothetical protein
VGRWYGGCNKGDCGKLRWLRAHANQSSTTDTFFLCLVLSQAIDTGTSLIYVPPTIASAFYSLIPGSKRASQYGSGKPSPLLCHVLKETKIIPIYAGFWTVPCFSVKQIELSFNEHRFAINPRDFYLGRVSARSTDCVAGILSMGNGLPANLAIIGDEFLKSCKPDRLLALRLPHLI